MRIAGEDIGKHRANTAGGKSEPRPEQPAGEQNETVTKVNIPIHW